MGTLLYLTLKKSSGISGIFALYSYLSEGCVRFKFAIVCKQSTSCYIEELGDIELAEFANGLISFRLRNGSIVGLCFRTEKDWSDSVTAIRSILILSKPTVVPGCDALHKRIFDKIQTDSGISNFIVNYISVVSQDENISSSLYSLFKSHRLSRTAPK